MQKKHSDSIKSLFLNDHFILILIVANALLIFVQEFDLNGNILDYFEPVFTLLFVVEMVVKISDKGFKNYISDPWNRLDFVLIIISIPSIAAIFFTNSILNLNVFLALRVFRVFKFFRLIRFFPHVSTFIASIQRALKASYIVIAGFCLIIFMVSIVTCALYKNVVPEYFSNPVKAFYSIFRLFFRGRVVRNPGFDRVADKHDYCLSFEVVFCCFIDGRRYYRPVTGQLYFC